MSDLIDFDSPNTGKANSGLASPLIPAPENSKCEGSNLYEAGPRRSIENNPFDMVLKKISDYEKDQEDPFEQVVIAMNKLMPKDGLTPRRRRFSDILKMNKTFDETESNLDVPLKENKADTSIITDLNDTNLIGDNVDVNQVVEAWRCDSRIVPEVNIFPPPANADLSILNHSAMNDSLLEEGIDMQRPRSMSQSNFLMPKTLSPVAKNRRSLSVTDVVKKPTFENEKSLGSGQSNVFDDPMNNAFRQISLGTNVNSSSSYVSNQFDLSNLSKYRTERLNSDSSVFSGLSNVSAIPMDSSAKIRNDRFYSENSIYSGISNLSNIPSSYPSSSSYDSSIFTNDTMNKGFCTSRSQLNSNSSACPMKNDNSDLIRKFYQIKTRMSTSETNSTKINNEDSVLKEKNNLKSSEEKLIDVDSSIEPVSNSVVGMNDIILQEARVLAETFEKMASGKTSNSTDEDDLLFSKTQLNFDDLPPSDDEAVDNLIELPNSPLKDSFVEKSNSPKIELSNSSSISPKDDIRALEEEFIVNDGTDEKAMAATLLLDLEKLIKHQDNPSAYKALNNLQELLGVHCDNNTEILQVCLQNRSSLNNKKLEDSKELNENNKSGELSDNQCSDNISHFSNCKSEEVTDNKQIVDSSHRINEKNLSSFQLEKTESISGNVESSSKQNEEQELAINLFRSLNSIVNEKNCDSAVDILKNLGEVLNMASELRTKNKDKQNLIFKQSNPNPPKLLDRLSSSFHKSPSTKKPNVKIQNKSLQTLPLRRSMSINPLSGNSNLLDVHLTKDKRKSHLLNIKKRFPSDPGFGNLTTDKIENKSPPIVSRQSKLATGKSIANPVKAKLKKKSNTEVVNKKGPMRAIIPLGSMQKLDMIGQRFAEKDGSVTPPKVPSINIVSSTPNSDDSNRNTKSKPIASSTPNIGLKIQRSKHASSLSTNSSLKVNVGSSRSSSIMRLERTLSPQKRSSTPSRKSSENTDISKLPRYSPRPVRVRNFSMTDLKSVKSPSKSGTVNMKTSSEKKIQQRHSVLSPLKNCNKLTFKGKPLSLASRLSKSGVMPTGAEKENYA